MNKALHCAVSLLARREHSLAELTDKLVRKGYAQEEIKDALAVCQRQGLQSDVRYAESLCRARIRQGYGPVRIRQELQSKNIARELIEAVLTLEHEDWCDHAKAVWEKKYNNAKDASFSEKQKQRQFLLYRGFSADLIAKIVR
jgi:regulatory protein